MGKIKTFLILALFFPAFAQAAILQFSGGETGVTTETQTTTGTASNQATAVKNGARAWRTNPTTTNTGAVQFKLALATGEQEADSGATEIFYTFWGRIDTCPASGRERFVSAQNTGNGNVFVIYANPDCTLSYWISTTHSLGTTTALSTGTWYHIKVTASLDDDAYELVIDGTTALSGTASPAFSGTQFRMFIFGKNSNTTGSGVDYYFDDIVMDSTAYANDTAYVLAAVPNGDGTHTGWSEGTNTSDYTQVDEVPSDSGTTYVASSVDTTKGSFNMQDSATVGITGTIHAVNAIVIVQEAASTASTEFQTLLISGATESLTTSRANLVNAYVTNRKLFTTDPDTSAAWTTAGFDAIEVGGVAVETQTTSFRMTQVTAHVLFTPEVVGGGGEVIINQQDVFNFY